MVDHNNDAQVMRTNHDRIDREVLNALKSGDEVAYTRIFIKYYDRIKRFALTLSKSEIAAEEIAQEVFAKMWEKHDRIDPSKNFNAYIYLMTRNMVIDFIRSEITRDSYTTDYTASLDDIEHFNSEDIAVAEEVKLIIMLAISSMPEQRRRIYEMRHEEGLSNEEIADRLCIRKETVAKQLSYGKADIRNALGTLVSFLMV